MRSRAMYTKTIRRWCKELGLTGRLVFCHSLILIALQGAAADVAEYLRRARTETVDVDSAGRKCRERMMNVLEDSAAAGRANFCDTNAAAGGGGLWEGGGGGGAAWPFSGFGEAECAGYGEAACLLGCGEARVLAYAGLAAPRGAGGGGG
ncbi:MAG: hypothetical protein J3K34DRAFT_83786 [Monoraphidium minutum]|nr:MAG: hypothetical protein J3K34DRAFT_83786 [Monoraphidium minutum]